ncbi:MAG TPA: hypothetical protein VI299_14110 [Polyangiales bacterium]
MIEQEDAEQLASLGDAVGKRKVLRARVRGTGGVVVHHDQARGALADQGAEHVAQAGRTCAQPTARELDPAQDALPRVERDRPQLFVLAVRQERAERPIHILAAGDAGAPRQGARHHALAELDGGREACGLAAAEAADARELPGAGPPELV